MAAENPLSSMAQKPGLDSAGESHAQSQLSSGTRAYNNSFKPVANCIPGPNLRRLLVGVHVEGKSLWLAAEGHHLVRCGHHRLLCCHCPSRRIRLESQVVGKSIPPNGSRYIQVGMNMEITEVKIRPANEALVKAYVSIVFDNCFAVDNIRVIKGPTGLFVSMPNKKQRDGTYRQLAYPADAETRMMIQPVNVGHDLQP